jgi:adenosylcobinamide-phosphate synthase
MNFFAVLLALLIEQLKPLPRDNWVHDTLISWVGWIGRNFDAGRERHAIVVWCITVLAPTAAAAAVYVFAARYSLVLALGINVVVLYLTLGFRQFSHYFTDIRDALGRGEDDQARRLLGQWRHFDASDLPRADLLRHVIEHSLLAAHRHVFGVFFCFIALGAIGLGPAGAVAYRMAEFTARYWAFKRRTLDASANERLMQFSERAFGLIDHVPARLTAFGFAVVGNFEEAINGWRRDAELWAHENEGVLLAAAAGALGVQLGTQTSATVGPNSAKSVEGSNDGQPDAAAGYTAGLPPQAAHLQSVVGLVWRSVVLWLLLTALLTLANLLG